MIATAMVAVAGLAVSAAGASPAAKAAKKSSRLIVGINDEAFTLYNDPNVAFSTLKTLRAQAIRVNLYWGGTKWAVAAKKPTDPTDSGDPNYDWAVYDRLVRYANQFRIQVVFSILFTPSWANGGQARTVAPKDFKALHDFAYAAASRYSGFYTPPEWQRDPNNATSSQPLPKVAMWTAWNEPNNPIWLTPQYKRVGKTWRVESAFQYAKICNAVYSGVHDVIISPERGPVTGEQVACGVTGPKGNDAPATKRASVDPLTFLAQAHRFGMKTFDVYAHHPYANSGQEPPSYVPTGKAKRRVQLGNINTLLTLISSYYGPKHLWITEYGYETNPPDKSIFGTSWRNQAKYMSQAYGIARKNPRIDMMLWFMICDEARLERWQSGLATIKNRRKPSWNVFKAIPRG